MQDLLDLANHLADAAADVIRRYYDDPAIAYKADKTPVTQADREAEAAMREIIARECPDHSMFGEEHGSEGAEKDYVWVLDPIDGTIKFMAGIPTFGTLIGLCHKGEPVLGLMNQPISGQRWSAIRGHATYYNGAPIQTRPCARLEDAMLGTTSPYLFREENRPRFDALRQRAKVTVYGTDCMGYAMLAAGRIDLIVESGLKAYDILPLVPIIESANGLITDWQSQPLRLREATYDVVVAGDAAVHSEALKSLR
jgi:inositol-phosphate phosphatase/L-galactose 1-phosphate phosphatase/histidinol-phosphatase